MMNSNERSIFLRKTRELLSSNIFELYKKCNLNFDTMLITLLLGLKKVKHDVKAVLPSSFDICIKSDLRSSFGIQPNGKKTKTEFDSEFIISKFLESGESVNKVLLGYFSEEDFNDSLQRVFELYQNEIKNAIKLQNKKSPDSGLMGRYAFPQNRKNNILPTEEDTDIESNIYHELDGHFNSGNSISDDESLEIQKFLANNEYHDVFKQPKGGKIYRGMSVSLDWLRSVLKDQYDDNSYRGIVNKNFVFNPLQNTQGSTSWTSDKRVAKRFAKDSCDMNMQEVEIVLIANPTENKNRFLNCKDGIYKLSMTQGFEYEHEIIGLGPINISSIEWIFK